MDEKRKQPGAHLHPVIVAMIKHHVIDLRWTNAAALYRKLVDDLRDDPLGSQLPEDERSVRTWMRKFQSQDSSGTWTLVNVKDTDPPAVMATLAAMLDDTDQQAKTLTNGEARIISALYRVDATIPPLEALYLARRYLLRERQDQPTDGLDRYVALHGWTLSAEEYRAYEGRGLFEGVGRYFASADHASGRGDAFDARIQISREAPPKKGREAMTRRTRQVRS